MAIEPLETTEYEFEDEYDVDEAIWDLSLNGYARGGFSARSGIQSRYVKIKLQFLIFTTQTSFCPLLITL